VERKKNGNYNSYHIFNFMGIFKLYFLKSIFNLKEIFISVIYQYESAY